MGAIASPRATEARAQGALLQEHGIVCDRRIPLQNIRLTIATASNVYTSDSGPPIFHNSLLV